MTTQPSHRTNPPSETAPQPTASPAAGTDNPDDPLYNLSPLGSDPYVRASTPPEILEGQDTFYRDLSELLETHRGKWVAYYGSKRIALEATLDALLKECARLGHVECLTRRIESYPPFDYISGIGDFDYSLYDLPPLGSDSYVRASTPPAILEGQETFNRDLPELLETHRGHWVAYYGSKRIALEPTEEALLKECARLGYVDYFSRCVYPYPPFDFISGI